MLITYLIENWYLSVIAYKSHISGNSCSWVNVRKALHQSDCRILWSDIPFACWQISERGRKHFSQSLLTVWSACSGNPKPPYDCIRSSRVAVSLMVVYNEKQIEKKRASMDFSSQFLLASPVRLQDLFMSQKFVRNYCFSFCLCM